MITLHKHTISGNIVDRYAKIAYHFDFENKNKHKSTELKFEITIDPIAFISKFEALIDGQLFIGQTKEKETAEKEYTEAKERDENTILIFQPHQDIPNLFQIKTNIDAKSKISLTIQIEQYIQKIFSFNQLTVQILRNFSKYNIKSVFPHISFTFTVEDRSAIHHINIPVTNTKDMNINKTFTDKTNRTCTINGEIRNQSAINELVLKYKTKGEENESQILFHAKSNTFCHILCDIMHEMKVDEGIKQSDWMIPRRVIFVIDRSGSMSGSKWDKTISSIVMAIKQLTAFDRFAVIVFNATIELLPSELKSTACVAVDDKHIADTIYSLQHLLSPTGSTNINDALLKAIEIIKNDIVSLDAYNFFINQIIFITDGHPNCGERDTKEIAQNVRAANDLKGIDKYSEKISIFSFGVGQDGNDSAWINDLNHSFLKILSLNNNGFYRRIRQKTADCALYQYFNMLSKPVLLNLNMNYKNKTVHSLTDTRFSALYAGNDVIIGGKIERMSDSKSIVLCLSISATTGQQIKGDDNVYSIKPVSVSKTIQIIIDNETHCVQHTEKIWAYLKLQQYAQQKLIYQDMIEVDDDEKKEHESLPLSLALKHKFVTPWTSMIVVAKKSDLNIVRKKKKIDYKAAKIKKKKNKKRMELHEYATATLGAGNMREAVRLPKGEDFNEWLAVNVVDIFNEITMLYGIINQHCTETSCPTMTAGPKYTFLWMDGKTYKDPHQCSAPEYIQLLTHWAADMMNDEKIFPTKDGVGFPSNFKSICKKILRRLCRVYAHIYHHHMQTITEMDAEAHLNTCFKHFVYFVKEFKLVGGKELAPLSDVIHHMFTATVQKKPKYKSKYQYK